ncbi:MAG: thioredoxin domain-containing protein [Candidatus Buchananbacteria bacterium]|nr:thioredoxin domain-containing protein [Candidatus Buchananbacteria bacterium]
MAKQDNKQFIFGLAIGIALISSIALIGLVIYIITGGRAACLAQCNGVNNNTSEPQTAKEFEQCLDSGKYDQKIQADQSLGVQLGVRGTPASFINGYLLSGALPYEAVKDVVDTLLAGEEPDQDFLKDQETGEIVKVDMPQITSQDHQKGAENGEITIVKFSEFECPYCASFKPTIQRILDEYPNKVTYVFKHFPLSFHQYARQAAVASECAAEQDKFWEMYDKLFELNATQNLNTANIKKAAVEIGLK